MKKIESLYYKAASPITGTSRDKIYEELGLESLWSKRWYKRPSHMLRIMKVEAPNYLLNLGPKCKPIIRKKNNRIAYSSSTVEQIVSKCSFFLRPKWLS